MRYEVRKDCRYKVRQHKNKPQKKKRKKKQKNLQQRFSQYMSLNTLFSPFKAPKGTTRRILPLYRKGGTDVIKETSFCQSDEP